MFYTWCTISFTVIPLPFESLNWLLPKYHLGVQSTALTSALSLDRICKADVTVPEEWFQGQYDLVSPNYHWDLHFQTTGARFYHQWLEEFEWEAWLGKPAVTDYSTWINLAINTHKNNNLSNKEIKVSVIWHRLASSMLHNLMAREMPNWLETSSPYIRQLSDMHPSGPFGFHESLLVQ